MQDYLDRAGEEGFAAALVRVRRFSMAPVTVRRLDDPENPAERPRRPARALAAASSRRQGMTAYILIAAATRSSSSARTAARCPSIGGTSVGAHVVLPIVGAGRLFACVPLRQAPAHPGKSRASSARRRSAARAPIDSPDAVGSLAHQFNAMADKMQELLESHGT
jgi:hypothetical protein